MAKYERGDIATYYFVIVSDRNGKRVQGYTDNKDLAEMYMQFHRCKSYTMKKMTAEIEKIYKILEENRNDEIIIGNLKTRDPEHKGKFKLVQVPATETELRFVTEECNSFMSSRISYYTLNEYITLLKPKYQRALKALGLLDVIQCVCYNKQTPVCQSMEMDELKMLFRSFPDEFG